MASPVCTVWNSKIKQSATAKCILANFMKALVKRNISCNAPTRSLNSINTDVCGGPSSSRLVVIVGLAQRSCIVRYVVMAALSWSLFIIEGGGIVDENVLMSTNCCRFNDVRGCSPKLPPRIFGIERDHTSQGWRGEVRRIQKRKRRFWSWLFSAP